MSVGTEQKTDVFRLCIASMVCLRFLVTFVILGQLVKLATSNRTLFASFSTTNSTLVQEETCEGQCGRQIRSRCSCDEMCFKDSSCCPDFLSKCEELNKRLTKLSRTYVYPKFMCTETKIVIISSCINNINLNDSKVGTISKVTENKEILFERTDNTNFFPVADLVTGRAFLNWDIFMCFSHQYSKPIILDAYIKHITIQKMKSFLYTVLLYEDLRFDFPKPTQASLSTCEQFSEDIFSSNIFKGNNSTNESYFADCAKCSGQLNSTNGDPDYLISIIPKMSSLYLRSENKSDMWSELFCKVDFEKQAIQTLSKHVFCVVVLYTSSIFETSDDYRHKLAVTKLAFNVKHDIHIRADKFSQILTCFLRDYANINILSIWRSPQFVQAHVIDQTFFIIKILMYHYIKLQPSSLTENENFLNSISKFSNFLYHGEMKSFLQGGSKEGSKAKDETRIGDELPEFDEKEFLPLRNDRVSDIICACSTTMEEIRAAKYLDTWICPVQCKLVTPSDNTSDSDDLMKIVRMCSDIETLSGTPSAQS
ncbi:hypothetical protein BgiMline_031827, partial [Biomphalaria glabrata]